MERNRACKLVFNTILFVVFFCVTLQLANAVSNDTVLCVSNVQHPYSADICQYYVNARPGAQWLNVSVPLSVFSSDASDGPWEHMTFANMDSYIRENISNYVAAHPEIHYLAIAKGLPIRVSNNGASFSGISAMWYLAINMSYNYSANSTYFDYFQSTASPPVSQNPLPSIEYIPLNNSRGMLNSYMDVFQNISYVSTGALISSHYLPGDIFEFNETNFTIVVNYGSQNAVYVSGPYKVRASVRPTKYYRKTESGYVLTKGPLNADVIFTSSNPQVAIDSYFFPFQYFVSYLTGYTYADITGMIDRATSNFSYTNEKTIIDYNPAATGAIAVKFVSNETIPNSLEMPMAGSMTTTNESVFAYIGWGKHQGKGETWVYNRVLFNTTNKSIATSIESFNARTFDVAAYETRGTYGASQGLIADLLSENASGGTNYSGAFTGVFGHVNEPYTSGVILFHRMIPYYLGGLPFAEAAMFAWPFQMTMGISVGDPLMTAFIVNDTQSVLPVGSICQSSADCASNICVQDAFNISRCNVQSQCVLGYMMPKDNLSSYGSYGSPLFVPEGESRCIQNNLSSSIVQCNNNLWSNYPLGSNESCSTSRRAILKSSGTECSSDSECNSYCATDFYGVQRCTDAYNFCPYSNVGILPTNMYYCGGGQIAYCKSGNTTGLKPVWSGYAPCNSCDSGICLDYFENATHYNLSRGKYLVSFPFSVNTSFFPNSTTYGPFGIRYDADSLLGIGRFGLVTPLFLSGNVSSIKNTNVFALSVSSNATNISIPKQPFFTQPPVQIIRGEYTPITTTVCGASYNASKLISVMQKFDSTCSELYFGGTGLSIWTSQIMYWYGPYKTSHPFGLKYDFNLSNITGYMLRCSDTTDFALALPCAASEINLTSLSDLVPAIYNTTNSSIAASFACNISSANNLSYGAIISNYTGSWITQTNISTFNTSANITWDVSLVGNTTAQWYCRACDLLDVCNETTPQSFTVITDYIYPDTFNPQLAFDPTTQSNNSNLSANSIYVNVSILEANLTNVTIWLYDETHSLISSSVNITNGIISHATNFTALADGIYYFNATAVDTYQNTNATVTYRVTIDAVAPNISYVSYSETTGTFVNRSWLAINVSANDSTTLLRWVNISVYDGAEILVWRQNASLGAGAAYGNLSLNITNLADGTYYYNATAIDWAGNLNATATGNITIDTITPNISYVTYTSTSGTNLSQHWLAINVSANDSTLNWINITVYNAALSLVWTQNYSAPYGVTANNLSLNITGLADGLYWFNASTTDRAGNVNKTLTQNITLDTTKPNISYVAYTDSNNSNVSRNWLAINVSVNDTNLRWINITVYNTALSLIWTQNYSAPFGTTTNNLSLNLTGLANGLYWFNASTTDRAGNTNQTLTRNITIDTIYPNISYVAYTDSTDNNVSRNWFAINVSANDTNLRWINISVYNSALSLIWTQNVSISVGARVIENLSLNMTSMANGLYYFNASVLDWSGNTNFTARYNITLDTINPNISYVAYTDSNGSNVSRNWLAINVSVNDTTLKWINITVYNAALALIWTQNYSAPFGTTTNNLSLNLTGLANGIYWFNASTTDRAGNTNQTLTRNITIDTIYPNISYVAYTDSNNLNVSRNWLAVNVSVNDTNMRWINITVYNSALALVWAQNYSTSYGITTNNLSLNLTGLADGLYWFNASTVDWAGNVNATATRNITLDTINPNISYLPFTEVSETNITRIWVAMNVSVNDTTLRWINISIYSSSNLLLWIQNYSAPSGVTIQNLSLNFTTTNDGTFYFNATATDWAGNTNVTATRSVAIDTQNPTISYAQSTDANNTEEARSWITVNVTANDTNLRWANISIYDEASALLWIQNSSSTLGITNSTFSINLTNLPDGVYYFNATVVDWSGRSNTTTTRKITLNRFTPFALVYPKNNWTLNVTQLGSRAIFDYIPINYSLQYWFNNHVINLSRASNSSSRIDAQIPFNKSGFQTLTFTINGGGVVRNVTLNITVNYSVPTLNDSVIGNETLIVTNIANLSLRINNSANISGNFTQLQQVEIKNGNRPLILFSHNFTQARLNLTETVVRTENATNKTTIIVFGLNHTKDLYIDLIGNISRDNSLCIKDAPVADFSELTTACSGANELYISTIPSTFSQYSVSYTDASNQTILVTGLNNTGIQQMCTESWQCGGWSTCSASSQSRSCIDVHSCGTTHTQPASSQSCSTQTASSSGGGGGGGSGAGVYNAPTSLVNKTNYTNSANTTGNAVSGFSSSQDGDTSAADLSGNTNNLLNNNLSSDSSSVDSLTGSKLEMSLAVWVAVLIFLVVGMLAAFVVRKNKSSSIQPSVKVDTNNKIIEYIGQQLSRNVTPLEIEKTCIAQGWERKRISQLIQVVLIERKKLQIPKRMHPDTASLTALKQYVQSQLKVGYTRTEIENALLTGDWEYEDIESSFK